MTRPSNSPETPNDADPARDRRLMWRSITAFLTAAACSVGLLYAGLGGLRAVDRLPPPPVSGTWCIDSRFAWLRDTATLRDASFVAVGSSTTWRNLDLTHIPSDAREAGALNAAPCFLTINQTRYLTEYYLTRAPEIKTLLTILTPRDFEGCLRNPTAFFDPEIVSSYLDGATSSWWLYFRNLRVTDIVMHAWHAGERRRELVYDRFGSGPLTRALPDPGRSFSPESSCFVELQRLAALLDSKGIRFLAVLFPIMPSWANRFDPNGQIQDGFRANVQSALRSTKAFLIDGGRHWALPDAAFTDPVHLQWPETAAFTRFVWHEAVRKGSGLPAYDASLQQASDAPVDDRQDDMLPDVDDTEADGVAVTATIPIRAGNTTPADLMRTSDQITPAMADAITQNTRGYSEGYAKGVPRNYAWCRGAYRPAASNIPAPDFTSVAGWGQIYPKVGAQPYDGQTGRIAVARAKTYVHLKRTEEWVLLQDQADNRIEGAHFVADFKPEPTRPMSIPVDPNGAAQMSAPPDGYNDHFWFARKGTFGPGEVDGVYVEMDMKTTEPEMQFVANVGADWWRHATAEFVASFKNNPGAGMSNWVVLTTEWTTLRFSSWSTARLMSNPPPPLRSSTPIQIPLRALNTASHCGAQR